MDKRAFAQSYAAQAIKKYRLISPSLDNLVFIAADFGFEIIDFGQESNPGGVAALISELALQRYIETSSAFTYQYKDIKLIFLCDSLTESEKRYALAHELGHIACGHMSHNRCSSDNIEDEFEANVFAHYLLNPSIPQRIQVFISLHKQIFIIGTLCILITASVLFFVSKSAREKAYCGNYYVTDSGERYHEKDCITIAGKESVHRMTKEEYNSGQYSPCLVCLPED